MRLGTVAASILPATGHRQCAHGSGYERPRSNLITYLILHNRFVAMVDCFNNLDMKYAGFN